MNVNHFEKLRFSWVNWTDLIWLSHGLKEMKSKTAVWINLWTNLIYKDVQFYVKDEKKYVFYKEF